MRYAIVSKVLFTAVIKSLTRYPGKQGPYFNISVRLKLIHLFSVSVVRYPAVPLDTDSYYDYSDNFL